MDAKLLKRACKVAEIDIREIHTDDGRPPALYGYLISAGWVRLDAECIKATVASRLVAKVRELRISYSDSELDYEDKLRSFYWEVPSPLPYGVVEGCATDEERILAALAVLEANE